MLDTLSKSHMDIRDQQIANLKRTNGQLRERIRELEDLFTEGWYSPSELGLGNYQTRILGLLMHKEYVTKGNLFTALYGDLDPDEWPDNPDKCIGVMICGLRKKLRRYDIHIVVKYRTGWRLLDDGKQKLRDKSLQAVDEPRQIRIFENEWPIRKKNLGPKKKRHSAVGQGRWAMAEGKKGLL